MGLARGLVGLGLRPSSAIDVVMVVVEGAGEVILPLPSPAAAASKASLDDSILAVFYEIFAQNMIFPKLQ